MRLDARVERKRVLTPVVDYSKAEQNVHVIGTMHMGSRNYYRRLQRIIDKYPVGIYEHITFYAEAYKDEARVENNTTKYDAFTYFAKYAGVKRQYLNYRNWKNVDIKQRELKDVSKHDVTLFKKFDDLAKFLDEIQKKEPEALARYFKDALIKVCRKEFAREPRLDAITRERESLLCDTLEKKLESKKITDLGIIYGAGHLYCVHALLVEHDFEIVKKKWIPAIEITENLSLSEARKRVTAATPKEAIKLLEEFKA